MSDLISVKRKIGSGKLEIITAIATSSPIQCVAFAELLLRDTTVDKLRKRNKKDDDMFVYEILKNWLSRNDNNPYDPAVPRTWGALAQCMENAGLEGVLVKDVKDTFC